MNLIAILALSSALSGSEPQLPDVSAWTEVSPRGIDFRVDDYRPCFVGTVTVYQNPLDPQEYVRVWRRHVALVSERPRERSDSGGQGSTWNRTQSDQKHHEKELQDKLKRARDASDAFGYARWRLAKDVRTGQEYQVGPMESWLLSPSGLWTYVYGGEIKSSPYSESLRANDKKNVVVGTKYWLGDTVHILRVRENDLIAPKVKKEDKAKDPAKDDGTRKEDGNAQ
jgi:hypothetical protein